MQAPVFGSHEAQDEEQLVQDMVPPGDHWPDEHEAQMDCESCVPEGHVRQAPVEGEQVAQVEQVLQGIDPFVQEFKPQRTQPESVD